MDGGGGGKEGRGGGGALRGEEETESTIWCFRKRRWMGLCYGATMMTNRPCCFYRLTERSWGDTGCSSCVRSGRHC